MIVRTAADHLVLVTQPDHAGLAADILTAWTADGFAQHPRRAGILLAAREHDNGWLEPDARPALDPASGIPYDFLSMPDDARQALWPRAIARLAGQDPFAAALVAEHVLTTFDHRRDEPAWRPFLAERRAERNRLLRIASDTEPGAPFAAAYRFVHLADLLSLIFCNGWTEPFDRAGYRIILRRTRLEVSPDPFGGRSIAVAVRARRIPRRRYRSEDDLLDTLSRSTDEPLTGVAAGQAGDTHDA